ncbi:MAG: ABC transporter permease [Oscillospiraceae bacterium]
MKQKRFANMLETQAFRSFLASLTAIVIGLLFGFVLLLVFDAGNALSGMARMLTTGLGSPDKFAKVLYQAAPLIMTGLSVGFAFKTGLFNIGASGQYLMGCFFALIFGIVLKCPWYLCMVVAMLGGAFWGMFPGLFKALFNVNEVITSIMFNWIALFLTILTFSNIPSILANFYGASNGDRTAMLETANPSAVIPAMGMDKLLGSNYMNISIFIAMIFALVMWVILQKTTFGYELKACGYNRNASQYAGINAKRNIVLSMVIAGALSGLAGGIYFLAGTAQFTLVKMLPTMGFNGIPVALLAMSHPLGTIFSALFISYIQVGGAAMQPEFAKETIDMIIAVIIYLSAFSLLMRNMIGKLLTRKRHRDEASALLGKSEQAPQNHVAVAADKGGNAE